MSLEKIKTAALWLVTAYVAFDWWSGAERRNELWQLREFAISIVRPDALASCKRTAERQDVDAHLEASTLSYWHLVTLGEPQRRYVNARFVFKDGGRSFACDYSPGTVNPPRSSSVREVNDE